MRQEQEERDKEGKLSEAVFISTVCILFVVVDEDIGDDSDAFKRWPFFIFHYQLSKNRRYKDSFHIRCERKDALNFSLPLSVLYLQ